MLTLYLPCPFILLYDLLTNLHICPCVLYCTVQHIISILKKSYYCQINICFTYILQLFHEVTEFTQLTGRVGGKTCDIHIQIWLCIRAIDSENANCRKMGIHLLNPFCHASSKFSLLQNFHLCKQNSFCASNYGCVVTQCLTRDRGVAGSSPNGVTALCP